VNADRRGERPDTREQEQLVRDQLYGPGSRVGDDIPPPEEVPAREEAPAVDQPPAADAPSADEPPAPDEPPGTEEPAADKPTTAEAPQEDLPPPQTYAGRRGRDGGEPEPPEDPPAEEADPQATVEADVLGPADEDGSEEAKADEAGDGASAADATEEARRALEAAAAREGPAAGAPPQTGPAEPETEAPAPATAAGKAAQAAAAAQAPTEVKPPKPPPPGEGGVPPGMPEPTGPEGAPLEEGDAKPPKPGLWPRFLAASFVIVISIAAATSTSLLLYLSDIAEGLGGIPGVEGPLADVEGGEPQSILILGSDIRPDIEDVGRSDTTMLLRLDADTDVLSLWSLPRDLSVNIPGYGIRRLNEAYALGGPKLTLQTVKGLTGLDIAHLVVVDFEGFARAVDAIGCVYVDVDRDYYHSNEGLGVTEQYAEIDIDSGYQRLCGPDALAYVRYRHDDNDIVRAARQQDFLREARAKVPPEAIWEDRHELIDIFTDYVTSDVDDPVVMLEVLKLFIDVRQVPVERVDFDTEIGGPNEPYVTVSDEAIQEAKRQFLGLDQPKTPAPAGGGGDGGAQKERGDDGGGGDGGGEEAAPPPLIDASDAAERYALEFDEELHFPVYAPTKLAEGSTYYDENDDSHTYGIDTPAETYGAYKLVIQRMPPFTAFGASEYYGVMGARWEDPPILENPTSTIELDGREYLLFYDGGRLRLVGWKEEGASYWVSNTLTRSLDEEEMLGIARSMRAYSPEQ
jgi:polyisoprenyl-teichoic acid--peptidoglycan teichoic acid transferase